MVNQKNPQKLRENNKERTLNDILNCWKKNKRKEYLSIQQIYDKLVENGIIISKPTIYKYIKLLLKKKEIQYGNELQDNSIKFGFFRVFPK